MSEILKRAAILSPVETFLLSLMSGAGGYAGLQALRSTMQKIHKPQVEKPNSVELNLHDPMSMSSPQTAGDGNNIPQLKTATADVDPNSFYNSGIAHYLAMGVGAPVGFLGAKQLYDTYQENQAKKEIEAAKQKYISALQQVQMANQKTAQETPCIDGFCEELAKQAGVGDWLPTQAHWTGNPLDWPTEGIEAGTNWARKMAPWGQPTGTSYNKLLEQGMNNPTYQSNAQANIEHAGSTGINNVMNFLSGDLKRNAEHAWGALAGLTSAAGLGAGIYFHNKKRKAEQKAQYPTTVNYADQ